MIETLDLVLWLVSASALVILAWTSFCALNASTGRTHWRIRWAHVLAGTGALVLLYSIAWQYHAPSWHEAALLVGIASLQWQKRGRLIRMVAWRRWRDEMVRLHARPKMPAVIRSNRQPPQVHTWD